MICKYCGREIPPDMIGFQTEGNKTYEWCTMCCGVDPMCNSKDKCTFKTLEGRCIAVNFPCMFKRK